MNTEHGRENEANTMTADALAPGVAKTSAAMFSVRSFNPLRLKQDGHYFTADIVQ